MNGLDYMERRGMGWHFQKGLKAAFVKLFKQLKDQENTQTGFSDVCADH